MVSKSPLALVPYGAGRTRENWTFGRFRLFPGSGILFPRFRVFPDRGVLPLRRPVFRWSLWSETRHASDSGFRIRRQQWREMRRGKRKLPASRDRVMPRVWICEVMSGIRKLDPKCLHPGLDRSADQPRDGLRTKNPRRGLYFRLQPK
jgi:hypothetical protein